MIPGPLTFYTIADALKDAVLARLTTAPERACVVPGLIADDECECGGQLAVAIQRTYYAETPPAEASGFGAGGVGPCELPYLVADLQVRLVRCAPGPDQRGNAPTCQALDTAALQVETDAYHARLATVCRLQEMTNDEIDGFLVRAQPRVGPDGSCVGSELQLSVWLVNRCPDC